MKLVLVLIATSMLLGGCATAAERAAQRADRDNAKCAGYGFKPGTEAFAQCRMTQDVERQRAINEAINSNSSCTTSMHGGVATTNCY